jgi:hypothetical protein
LRYRRSILVAVLVVIATYAAAGQTVNAPQRAAGPLEIVRPFYAWYLHRLNKADYDPLKNRTMALKYLTPEFLRRVPRLQHDLEADVIVCAQDVDPAWEKGFKVESATIRGAHATALLALSGDDAAAIKHKVTLKRTRAGWRIDAVDCDE